MRLLWTKLYERVTKDGRVALVTLIAADGSTPREAGARMIVTREGHILGTIGGGMLEYRVIEDAKKALRHEKWSTYTHDVPLGPELGQCCGGRITYLIEIFGEHDLGHIREFAELESQGTFSCEGELGLASHLQRRVIEGRSIIDTVVVEKHRVREVFKDNRTTILLFGAGHIGRALTLALAPLPFHVRWIDNRDGAFPELIPQNVTAIRSADMDSEIHLAPSDALVLIMTHSHALDLAIVASALARDDLPFVGLIGSDTKRARFTKRLSEMGLGQAAAARLVSPIGLPAISGKEPAVIAASVAADLLIRRELLQLQSDVSSDFNRQLDQLEFRTHPHE